MVKSKFISDIKKACKDLNIPYNEDCWIINMDEIPCFLDMYYETTIDFIGNKNVDIQTTGKEKYRIYIILAITGDGYKLPAFVIVKGEEGKTIEKQLQDLYYDKNHEMYVHCQSQGWCTTELFCSWTKEVFLPYENFIDEKCLLVLNKASVHVSNESLYFLEKKYNELCSNSSWYDSRVPASGYQC